MEKREVTSGAITNTASGAISKTSINSLGQGLPKADFVETPTGLRRLSEVSTGKDFSGFQQGRERGNLRRMVEMEREIRIVKETLNAVLEKQDQLIMENEELKRQCDGYQNIIKTNNEVKKVVDELKKENEAMKLRCKVYEAAFKTVKE